MKLFKFYALCLCLLTLLFAAPAAMAACNTPAGENSQTRYDFVAHKMFVCNGSTWLEIPGGAGGGMGCVLDGVQVGNGATIDFYSAQTHANCNSVKLARTCTDGVLSGSATYQYFACSTIDTTPNAFSFNDVTGASTSTLTTPSPASITITGIDAPTAVSVSGQGSPQIRINGGSWVTSGTISNGQTLAVRLTSAGSMGVTYTATIDVGGVTDSWTVTTAAADTTPNAFSFNDVTGAALSTLTTPSPATVTISGINASTPVSVSGTGSPQISINGGGWTTSGSITNGQTLAVRLTSSASNNTTNTATINVGGVTDSWSVTTVANSNCTLDGVTVLNGNSRTFYSTTLPPYGNRCTSYQQTRTCSSGVLSGSASYNRANCTDNCAANEGNFCGYYCVNACMSWCGGCGGGYASGGSCSGTPGGFGCFSGGNGLLTRTYSCAGTCPTTNWP